MPTIRLPGDLTLLARPRQAARARLANSARRDWYRIEAKANADEADIYIYDEIGYWGLTAADFVSELQAVKASKINLHLNTPGGDVFDGIAIHNALRQHAASVHVTVDSLAASIGSVIAMAGDTVTMAKHATMMIHDPYGGVLGNASDMRQMADVLDQLGDNIAGVYAERAGGSVREWRDRMLAETWYSDRAAVDAGLADTVAGDTPADGAENGFDLSIFRHPPEELQAAAAQDGPHQPTKRDIERALRDAGLTRGQAKALLAAAPLPTEQGEARDVADLMALRDAIKTLL
jgi:ATP-dependent protease ClpP protease subunit